MSAAQPASCSQTGPGTSRQKLRTEKIFEAISLLPIAAPDKAGICSVEYICELLFEVAAEELLKNPTDQVGGLAAAILLALELILEKSIIAEYALPQAVAASAALSDAFLLASSSRPNPTLRNATTAIAGARFELETLFPVPGKGSFQVSAQSLRKKTSLTSAPTLEEMSKQTPLGLHLPSTLQGFAEDYLTANHYVVSQERAKVWLSPLYGSTLNSSDAKKSVQLVVRPEHALYQSAKGQGFLLPGQPIRIKPRF